MIRKIRNAIKIWTFPVAFGMVFCFFGGISLCLEPWQHTIRPDSPYNRFTNGNPWMVGVFFLLLSVFAILRPVWGAVAAVCIIAALGFYFSIQPFNSIGLIIYGGMAYFAIKSTAEKQKLSKVVAGWRAEYDARKRARHEEDE